MRVQQRRRCRVSGKRFTQRVGRQMSLYVAQFKGLVDLSCRGLFYELAPSFWG